VDSATGPILLVVDPLAGEAIDGANATVRDQLARRGRTVDTFAVNADYAAELPAARVRAYAHLEEFFNLNLYDYNVKVGPTKEIK
jgi:myosin-crossreactive antigen